MGKSTSETARLAGQKSRRGPAKKDPIVHDAMEILLTEGMAKPQDDRFTQEFKDNRSGDWSKKKTDFMDEERNRR